MPKEEGLKKALENVLSLFDVKIDDLPKEDASSDMSSIMEKTQEKLDELNQKAEELYQKTGLTREQLEAYASNPNNFTKEQWDALQRVKEEAERFRRRTRENMNEDLLKKTTQVERKRQPHRFGKKKNWIPL